MKTIVITFLLFAFSITALSQNINTMETSRLLRINKRWDYQAKTNLDYSGVYKGEIGRLLCCEDYETFQGWIAFDFTQDPPVILEDGCFWDGNFRGDTNVHLTGDSLIGEYLDTNNEYEKEILGVFDRNKGVDGYWYNYNDPFLYEASTKSFLKKTGGLGEAQALIDKYKKQNKSFDALLAT